MSKHMDAKVSCKRLRHMDYNHNRLACCHCVPLHNIRAMWAMIYLLPSLPQSFLSKSGRQTHWVANGGQTKLATTNRTTSTLQRAIGFLATPSSPTSSPTSPG